MNSELLDSRLARTPYFVLPKLAIKAMSEDWQNRFEQLCKEADETGIQTPTYVVFLDLDYQDGSFTFGVKDVGQFGSPHYVFGGRKGVGDDPWANYKYGDVKELCPKFKALEG